MIFSKEDNKIWSRLYMRYKRTGYEPIAKWQQEYDKLIELKKQIIEDEKSVNINNERRIKDDENN